jgi:hypothetical protein
MIVLSSSHATSTAPPSAFFERWAAMDTWPEWDEAVRWVRRDGPFAAGTTGSLKPRGGPKVSFVIETVDPGREFTDRSSMPGASLTIRHLVAVEDDGRTRVDIEVSLDGPLARVWKVLVGRGIATSTPAGLGRLVQVVEADMAVADGTDGGRDAEVGP